MVRNHEAQVRVLYSFPHKLGANRICYTAWQQVNGLAAAGAEILAVPGVLHRPVPEGVKVRTTLSRGRFRIPYKMLGKMRALALHDRIVARMLPGLVGKIDLIHAWPAAAVRTLRAARQLGIPTVIERPNAHTRFAFDTVGREFSRLGLEVPPDDEYFFNAELLAREEQEYELADFILCPSDFVAKTFVDQGVSPEKLLRHAYGYDEQRFYPDVDRRSGDGLTVLFAGVCAVRKGLHFALEAWSRSAASKGGRFLIAGQFLPSYRERLSGLLSQPGVEVLGQRSDMPELMRRSDLFVLPSLEEGFPLVVAEAVGSGCVPLTSDACCQVCEHLQTGLVHTAGDIETLTQHFTMLHENRQLLERLRAAVIGSRHRFTWTAAGVKLRDAYRQVLAANRPALLRAESPVSAQKQF